MNTLHLVGSHCEASPELAAIRIPGDALVWLEEAVPHALASAVDGPGADVREFVLQPDLERRGLGARDLREGVGRIDYAGLAELVAEYPRSFTW